jgi:hypothetical protein
VQTQTLINEGIIELYRGLIEEDDVGIIKEVLWGLSNICAGTVSQIERVFECGLLNRVLEIANYLLLKVDEDKTYYEVNSNFFNLLSVITSPYLDFERMRLLYF